MQWCAPEQGFLCELESIRKQVAINFSLYQEVYHFLQDNEPLLVYVEIEQKCMKNTMVNT